MREKENSMDINEIKKLIREDGAKVVIADEQGGAIIAMDYNDYKKLKGEKIAPRELVREDVGEIEQIERKEVLSELEDEPLKIDDLPF
jgi:glutamate dehydrogenase/leucine dehydrogenase